MNGLIFKMRGRFDPRLVARTMHRSYASAAPSSPVLPEKQPVSKPSARGPARGVGGGGGAAWSPPVLQLPLHMMSEEERRASIRQRYAMARDHGRPVPATLTDAHVAEIAADASVTEPGLERVFE